ncbi:hypothetical protein [Streptomyces sp. NBC_00687]|uniref:hypothetical protein n=1 Tax=Streptomyces sp. NBC_00687 TaxID=2975807 RepID=UPI00225A76DE|nr:hypothetical protein [Streptomyces sp. NBC_00687]MCX4919949.1 hypothetical protein [Streptomyces sp. NBC_00687]
MVTITPSAPADQTAGHTPRSFVQGSVLDSRVEEELGGRWPGAVYQNSDGQFEVLFTTTDPAKVKELLHRRGRFALIVRDTLRPDGEPFIVGSAWTNSDTLVRRADRPTR